MKTDIDLDQYRADFKRVWLHASDIGLISREEFRVGYAQASVDVRARMGDLDWIAAAAAEARAMVEQIESDLARSERIRAERREEQKRAA